MHTLNEIILWVGTFVILISFILALILPLNLKQYMKGFLYCPLIGLLVSINSINAIIFFLYANSINFFIQSFLQLCDLVFWLYFFKKVLKRNYKASKIDLIFIFTLIVSIYILYFNRTSVSNLHINALCNLCKSIFCILFYNSLFRDLPDKNILKEPSFWIVTGLIFYSCLSLPFYALNSYIREQFVPIIASNIFSISNMLIIIMHLFFIKAYICTIQLRKV